MAGTLLTVLPCAKTRGLWGHYIAAWAFAQVEERHNAAWTGGARATGGIIAAMRRFQAYFLVVSLSALLVLSSVGPLLDHHTWSATPRTRTSARRGLHVHDYAAPDTHDHARPLTPDASRGVVALLDRDAGFAGVTNVVMDRDGATTFVYFEHPPFSTCRFRPRARRRSEADATPTSLRGCSPSPCTRRCARGPCKEAVRAFLAGLRYGRNRTWRAHAPAGAPTRDERVDSPIPF